MPELTLTLTSYSTDRQWSWELSCEGVPLASHDIQVDPADPSFEAFTNVQAYVTWQLSPRAPQSAKSDLLDDLGRWITARFFGAIAPVLCDRSPATVNVVLPPAAAHFASWPFELAWYDGAAIVMRNIVFTYEVARAGPAPASRTPTEAPIRVLGVFALPAGERPLSLRDERRRLETLFQELSAGAALDVRFSFVQYGVTRQRLDRVLRDPEGWDIIHVSAHGVAGGLALEAPDGSLDIIGGNDLLRLLESAAPRLRLLVLASCSSAGAAFDRPHRQLATPENRVPEREPTLEVPVFGSVVADKTGCAVVAMRFPVPDEYAISLSLHLYHRLIVDRQPLTRGLHAAVADAVRGMDVLGLVTPVLLGNGCGRIVFRAATLPHDFADESRGLSGADTANLPDMFVGRTDVVARVVAALAPGGTARAAVLYGMPGSGKTATAAEIAHAAADSIGGVIWLSSAASDGFGKAALADNQRRRVLYVADEVPDSAAAELLLESLANDDGSRLLMTTTRQLDLPGDHLLWERLGALTPEESALLVGHCPNLRALLTLPGPDEAQSATLVNEAVHTARGNPGLIVLADAHARDQDGLSEWLTLLRAQWPGVANQDPVSASAGSTERLARDMLDWTRRELALLPEPEAGLLQTICRLAEADRLSWFMRVVCLLRTYGDDLDNLTEERQRALIAVVDHAVELLCDRGLVLRVAGAGSDEALYTVPTVVDLAVRQVTTPDVARELDTAAKNGWLQAIAVGIASPEHERGSLISSAYWSIVPYLLRLGDPDLALHFLNLSLDREFPSAPVTEAFRMTERIAQSATNPATRRLAVFAGLQLLARVDAVAALREIGTFLATLDDQELRPGALSLKVTLLQQRSRFDEALVTADELVAARERNPDIWWRFDAEGVRLTVLRNLGRYEEVYERAKALWAEMAAALTALGPPGDDRYVIWNAYEMILQAGALAARPLEKYEESLAMNRARRRSLRERDAPVLWQASALYDDFLPLLKLSRIQEARQVCLEVLPTARAEGYHHLEVSALGSLSEVELALDYVQDAYRVGALSLTMLYEIRPFDRGQLITAHNRMANTYQELDQWPEAFAHHVACVMLCILTSTDAHEELLRFAADLCHFREPPLPASLPELTDKLAAMHPIDFAAAIDDLAPDPDAAARAFQEALSQARAIPPDEVVSMQAIADTWGSAMAASAASLHGDQKARHWLHHRLGPGGNELTRAFLLIADGREHDIDTAAMSPLDEYIVDITRRMIAGETHIVFATTPPWDNPDLDVIESGIRAFMDFAQGVAHDQGAITAHLELLDRSGGQAFARALRLFMAGERSRLLAVDLPSEEATFMVRLIKLSAIGGKDQEDRD